MAASFAVRPEDKPKVAMIIIGIMGINVYVVSRVVAGMRSPAGGASAVAAPAAAPASAAAPVASAPAPSAPSAGAKQVASATGAGDVKQWNRDDSLPPSIGNDPFRPIPGTLREGETAASEPTKAARSNAIRSLFKMGLSDLESRPILHAKPLPPMGLKFAIRPANPTAPLEGAESSEPAVDVEVKGIIEDEKAMAVLRVGERTAYKMAGDRLEGGMVIEKVTPEGVTVRYGNLTRILSPGQSFKSERSHGVKAMTEERNSF